MRSTFALTLISFACLALWLAFGANPGPDGEPQEDNRPQLASNPSQQPAGSSTTEDINQPADSIEINLQRINNLLRDQQFQAAVRMLDELYPGLSSEELERFKVLFLDAAAELSRTQNNHLARDLLVHYTRSYDDTDAWNQLGNVLMMLEDWQPALNAFIRSSALEFRPEELVRKLSALVQTSGYVRAALEKQGDEYAINRMYQELYRQHPNYPRFQLELALSHLRLGQTAPATMLLEALMYDPELGAIARQTLSKTNASIASKSKAIEDKRRSEQHIVVPLTRVGDSFLVDVSINNGRVQLLLDTGASITALSRNTIKALKLRPTGSFVQLRTANGPRKAQLYQTGKIRIGNMIKDSFVIAEIDLEQSVAQGLLGTDLLNQMDSRYSYIIDNEENALIFRSR